MYFRCNTFNVCNVYYSAQTSYNTNLLMACIELKMYIFYGENLYARTKQPNNEDSWVQFTLERNENETGIWESKLQRWEIENHFLIRRGQYVLNIC